MFGADPIVRVRFNVDGVEGVGRALKFIKDQAGPMDREWGVASRHIAFGLESIARQGKITGESLKGLLAHGADMAFMFGPEGAIVGALAVTGAAIYEHVVGGMKAAQEEAKKTADALRDLVNAGDKSALYKQAAAAYRGTPSENFADGVVGLTNQKLDLEAKKRGFHIQNGGLNAWRKLSSDLDDVNKKLEKQTALFNQLRAAYNAPMPYLGAGMLPGMTSTAKTGTMIGKADPLTDRYIAGNGMSPFRFMNEITGIPLGKPFGSADFSDVKAHAGTGVKNLFGTASPMTQTMIDGMKNVAEIAGRGFADTLADSIEAGVTRLFQKGANIGGVFAAIADTALAGLGSIATKIGRAALAQFAFIGTISKAIAALNPAIGIPAAIALIALGSALGGAGNRIGANAGGGGGYGGSGAYSASNGYGASIVDRGIIDPTRGGVGARSGNNYTFNVIGLNDPKAQSDILRLIANAERRGMAA